MSAQVDQPLAEAAKPHLAEFNCYPGMIAALRARAFERKIALGSEAAAQIAGLPDRYLTKLLGPKPPRRLGLASMNPVLELLGVKFVLVEDPEALAKYDARTPKMQEKDVRSAATTFTISKRFLRKIGAKGGFRKAAVLKDKLARRERWRRAKARQRAAARTHGAIAAPADGVNT